MQDLQPEEDDAVRLNDPWSTPGGTCFTEGLMDDAVGRTHNIFS